MRKRWVERLITRAITATLIFVLIACSHNTELDPQVTNNSELETSELNIWLEQGYNIEENEAIREVVTGWEKLTGNQIKLSFFSTNELTAKAKEIAQKVIFSYRFVSF